jgi:hypothetical protein
MTSGPFAFWDPATNQSFRWSEGHGDRLGQDVIYVPDTMLQQPYFARALRLGLLRQVTAEEAIASMDGQGAAYATEQANLAVQAQASLHRPEVNDIVEVDCVAPGRAPGSHCSQKTGVRQSELGKIPPLCGTHEHLRQSFVPSETMAADGRGQTEWVLVTMAPRQTEMTQQAPPA